ncbi:TolC family protein [Flavobacterium sp. ASW18X]|uniref:TolC family protein n=1 Tax=Flavobacterium sp. ASW18X TaxID=2572595 RepID=UPI0010AE51F0|nr:TolC family protein [Flavobacterium sp. ASW18X]TKD67295.1 TolC family protein [Flavobacterium sp. ASW18X]
MQKIFYIPILLFSWVTLAQEEVPTSFTLQEAVAYALENNYTAINSNRDMVDAQKQKWETIATGLPQINGNVSYQNQLKQPVSVIPAEFFGGEPGTFEEVVFSTKQSASATATLTQLIFDGSYIVGVQAAKTFVDYTQNTKEKSDLEVKKSVVEAYGNVLLAQESVAILEKNKSNLEKNVYETEKILENGLTEEENLDQLKITLASINSQLKNAIRLKEITLQMFNLIIGLPIETPTILEENLDELTEEQIDFKLLETPFSLSNNVDYKLMTNLNEQRQLELKLAKSKALPTLSGFVNYGTSAFSNEFTFFNGDQEWFDSSVLGIEMNIPIFSSFKRSASTQRARIALDKAKTQMQETEQMLQLQWERAKSNYTLAIDEYQTSKDNLALAERIERKNQIKYDEGIATSFELREAQTQLYSSQQEYLQSMVDVINQKTELETVLNNN